MALHVVEWSASHPGYFTAGKRTLSTHGSRAIGWHQKQSVHFAEDQYLLLQPGIESLIVQPVAVTMLSRLLLNFSVSNKKQNCYPKLYPKSH
jgi:hypothetical protein